MKRLTKSDQKIVDEIVSTALVDTEGSLDLIEDYLFMNAAASLPEGLAEAVVRKYLNTVATRLMTVTSVATSAA